MSEPWPASAAHCDNGDSAPVAASAEAPSQPAPTFSSPSWMDASIRLRVSESDAHLSSSGIDADTPGPALIILCSSSWVYPRQR